MKKLLTYFALLILCVPLSAQDHDAELSFNKRGNRDEIRAGWSTSPLYFLSDFYISNYFTGGSAYSLGNAYHDLNNGSNTTGVFTVEYCHFFKNWLSMCVDLGITPLWSKKTNAFGVEIKSDTGFMVHLLPKVRFTYLRLDVISLYSDVGLGIAVGPKRGTTAVCALFHATPIGVTVGKRVYGFAEANLSMRNIGCTIGAGYRF